MDTYSENTLQNDITFILREMKVYFIYCIFAGIIVVYACNYAGLNDITTEVILFASYIVGLHTIIIYCEELDRKENEHNNNRQEGMHKMQQDGNHIGEQRTQDQSSVSRKRRKRKHKWRGSDTNGIDTLPPIHSGEQTSGELQGSQPDVSAPGTDPSVQPPI